MYALRHKKTKAVTKWYSSIEKLAWAKPNLCSIEKAEKGDLDILLPVSGIEYELVIPTGDGPIEVVK